MGESISRRAFLTAASSSLFLQWFSPVKVLGDSVAPNLDHIILGCNDLDRGIEFMEKLSGYRAAYGGVHPGRGTRNALLSLGNHRYLEILAPDPKQGGLQVHKEIADMTEPLLIGYAIRYETYDDLEHFAASLRKRGIACFGPMDGERTRPDGQTLRWKTVTKADDKGGILPFYIAWGEDSPHPSDDAPGACLLMDFSRTGLPFREGHPPTENAKKYEVPGKTTQNHAKIAGLTGIFELHSRAVPSEAWTNHP